MENKKVKEKIEKQIQALEFLIRNDKNQKDKEIHKKALTELKKRLACLE